MGDPEDLERRIEQAQQLLPEKNVNPRGDGYRRWNRQRSKATRKKFPGRNFKAVTKYQLKLERMVLPNGPIATGRCIRRSGYRRWQPWEKELASSPVLRGVDVAIALGRTFRSVMKWRSRNVPERSAYLKGVLGYSVKDRRSTPLGYKRPRG